MGSEFKSGGGKGGSKTPKMGPKPHLPAAGGHGPQPR